MCLKSDAWRVTWGDMLYVISCYSQESFWQINTLCNIFSGGQFSSPIASFGAVMEPPCRDRYIPSFMCQQCPYSRPSWGGGAAAVMYRSPDKIECRPLLKCEQGAGVWGCSVFSECYGLRELACGCLDFIEGWMSQLGKIICRPPAFVALWRGQCDIIWHIAIVYPVSVLFEEMSGIPILPFWTTFACAVIPAV